MDNNLWKSVIDNNLWNRVKTLTPDFPKNSHHFVFGGTGGVGDAGCCC